MTYLPKKYFCLFSIISHSVSCFQLFKNYFRQFARSCNFFYRLFVSWIFFKVKFQKNSMFLKFACNSKMVTYKNSEKNRVFKSFKFVWRHRGFRFSSFHALPHIHIYFLDKQIILYFIRLGLFYLYIYM